MKKKHKKNNYPHKIMRARLSFDEGFRERPIYSIKGNITEKDKGLDMLDLIRTQFNISDRDQREFFREKLRELDMDAMTPTEPQKIKRDEEGRIVSPFALERKPFGN